MADPQVVSRTTPTSYPLPEGHPTKIAFSAKAGLQIWEKQSTPPGAEMGSPVEQTTFWNSKYETFAPPPLIKITDGKTTCGYNPADWSDIISLLGINQTVCVEHPDGSHDAFFGYLSKFDRKANSKGKQPEADAEFVTTNIDPSTGAEAGPKHYAAAGT
jgi:hypothetical protein